MGLHVFTNKKTLIYYSKWKLVHQFGVNENQSPPCYQDLTAPQSPLKNLYSSNSPQCEKERFYVPMSIYCQSMNSYKKPGKKVYQFINTKTAIHYVSYYKWIFDSPNIYLE